VQALVARYFPVVMIPTIKSFGSGLSGSVEGKRTLSMLKSKSQGFP